VDNETPTYDLAIVAVGFESRAPWIATKFGQSPKSKLGIGFSERQALHFQDNLRVLKEIGYEYFECSDAEFGLALQRIRTLLMHSNSDQGDLRIAIDISCFNRFRLAQLVEFAGWSCDPALPPAAVIGLGYEENKALGAVDHLQVSRIIALLPHSPIPEYSEALGKANRVLLESLPEEARTEYEVMEPCGTFQLVENVVAGLEASFNPVILPFGPKIFFVISLLVACYHPATSVWRVSAQDFEEPVDRAPSQHTVAIRAIFDEQ
jgi:hypothetical protein